MLTPFPSLQEHTKLLVRGYSWAEFHADIYDQEEEKLRKAGLDAQCLGGGRIIHDPSKNYIKVSLTLMSDVVLPFFCSTALTSAQCWMGSNNY